MENNFGPTISMMISDDQLRACSCNQDKAIFYCFQSCGDQVELHAPVYYCIDKANCSCKLLKQIDIFCCLKEHAYQREYCLVCAQQFHLFHGSITLAALVHELDKHHWAPLFEKIAKLDEIATQKIKPYLDLVILLEDMYQKMVANQHEPQSQPFFNKMYAELKQLSQQVINEYKQKIEELLNKKEVTELFGLRSFYHQFNQSYEALKSLEQFDPHLLYERYTEVFQYQFQKDNMADLQHQSFLLFKDFKRKFLESLINKTNEIIPQGKSKQELIDSLFLEYFVIEEVQSQKKPRAINSSAIGQEILHFDTYDRQSLNTEIQQQIDNIQMDMVQEKYDKNRNQEQLSNQIQDINEKLTVKISKLEQLLLQKFEEAFQTQDSLYFNDKYWKVLFGVSYNDNFDTKDEFWTNRSEKNSKSYRNLIHYTCSFKLKALWEEKIEKLLIYSESGKHVVLALPFEDFSLMDYFDDYRFYSLTYVSGAQSPYDLVGRQYGKHQLPNQWCINYDAQQLDQQQTFRLGGIGQRLKNYPQQKPQQDKGKEPLIKNEIRNISLYGAIVCGL